MLLADLDPAKRHPRAAGRRAVGIAGGGEAFAAPPSGSLSAGVPVAAICGATGGRAPASVDARRHTSAAAEYLPAPATRAATTTPERAVVDGDPARPARSRPSPRVAALSRPSALPRSTRTLRGSRPLPPRRPGRLPGAHAGRRVSVPPREAWPEPDPQSEAGALLTDVILTTFRLNGRLKRPGVRRRRRDHGGVVAGARRRPGRARTVAEIGRRMGMTRQGVQRVADCWSSAASPSTARPPRAKCRRSDRGSRSPSCRGGTGRRRVGRRAARAGDHAPLDSRRTSWICPRASGSLKKTCRKPGRPSAPSVTTSPRSTPRPVSSS